MKRFLILPIFFVISLGLTGGCGKNTEDSWLKSYHGEYITTPELKSRIKKEPATLLIIDLRPPNQYRGGHIPGATNIPMELLDENSLPDNAYLFDIVIYHSEQVLQKNAYLELQGLGYNNAAQLSGGFRNWNGEIEED